MSLSRSPHKDWSRGGGGVYKMGKLQVRNCLRPPPLQDRVKLFVPPLLKSGNFTCPPYNMAKTLSYRVKTSPKNVVPPPHSEWLKLLSPPLFVGVKLHVPPPLPFCSPPLPVISDQSLRNTLLPALRIDTSGWGVNSGALFHKAWISCFLRL